MSEKEKAIAARHAFVTGVIYDFAGFLTTLKESVQVGSKHNVYSIVRAITEWSDERGINTSKSNSEWRKLLK
jgi:hypothetical protein